MSEKVVLNHMQAIALLNVVRYNWEDEEADYSFTQSPRHIFRELKDLASVLVNASYRDESFHQELVFRWPLFNSISQELRPRD